MYRQYDNTYTDNTVIHVPTIQTKYVLKEIRFPGIVTLLQTFWLIDSINYSDFVFVLQLLQCFVYIE